MAEVVTVRYRTQFCLGDRDITGDFHAADDADMVRFWEGDFCLLEVSRDDDGSGWVATGGNGPWVELGEMPFSSPMSALRAFLPADRYALVEETD